LEKYESLRPLRDDFIDFVEVVLNYGFEFNYIQFNDFWTKIAQMKSQIKQANQPIQCDHVFIAIHELFLYFIAALLKKEKFAEIEDLLTEAFLLNIREVTKASSFFEMYHLSTILDQRNRRLQLNRVNPMFDLFVQRENKKLSFAELRDADIMLYYIGTLNDKVGELLKKTRTHIWFPITSIRESYGSLLVMEKASKARFFEKIKILFGVQTKEELIEKCARLNNASDFNYRIPIFKEGLNLTNLAIFK
jgi:hypothetical protein